MEPPHAKTHSAQTVSRKSAVCTRRLTEKRTLQPIPHGKAHSVPAMPPRRDGKAQSARRGSRKLRLFVRRRAGIRPSAGPRAAPAPTPPGGAGAPPRRRGGGRPPPPRGGPPPPRRHPLRAWRPPRAGGGPWVSAAGRRASGQATARVCVQRAKEVPGSQGNAVRLP